MLSAQFVYVMLGMPACVSWISGASTDAVRLRKFQCSAQNVVPYIVQGLCYFTYLQVDPAHIS